jgi:hypothetical protein
VTPLLILIRSQIRRQPHLRAWTVRFHALTRRNRVNPVLINLFFRDRIVSPRTSTRYTRLKFICLIKSNKHYTYVLIKKNTHKLIETTLLAFWERILRRLRLMHVKLNVLVKSNAVNIIHLGINWNDALSSLYIVYESVIICHCAFQNMYTLHVWLIHLNFNKILKDLLVNSIFAFLIYLHCYKIYYIFNIHVFCSASVSIKHS